MQTVKQILQDALQRCIDEHGVLVMAVEVTVNNYSTVNKRNYLIDRLEIKADIVDSKGGE